MGRNIAFGILLVLLLASATLAKLSVRCDVKEVARHKQLVTLEWKVTVKSDKTWDACDLNISFQDADGAELFAIKETKKVQTGSNAFDGHKIHDLEQWDRVKKYVATFDCIFDPVENLLVAART